MTLFIQSHEVTLSGNSTVLHSISYTTWFSTGVLQG